ncbi:hypothetical protein WR25_25191 [Diploscapter pachys]|uniref:Integrator complex subunit 7 n=1 Tax=Diploscapter pachys TaxID=2018661 RepID=A0A2A2L2V5_9BILA|nr:hypothetical protein WR25_25191 [Diploscapter pachys]
MEDSLTTNVHLQNFDKGLKARSLGEQLATLSLTASLLEDHPIPMFVNAVVMRLAEAFRDGSNALRQQVVRAITECCAQLSLVFSGNEILKRVIHVSHSNDPDARRLTLEMLRGLAPIVSEDKRAHHLILQSLNSSYEPEFRSAARAMAGFTAISSEFSETVMPAVSTLLLSPSNSYQRKAELINIFASMKASMGTVQKVFSLAQMMLDTCENPWLVTLIIQSTTALAEATRYTVPQQISILLSACQSKSIDTWIPCLQNLQVLTKHAHLWTDEQIKTLFQLQSHFENGSDFVHATFLDILISFSRHARPVQLTYIADNLEQFGGQCSLTSTADRIRFLELCCLIFIAHPSKMTLPSHITMGYVGVLDAEYSTCMAKRLMRSIYLFLTHPSAPPEDMTTLLTSLISLDPSFPHLPLLIEMFAALVNQLPSTSQSLQEWAQYILQEKYKSRHHSALCFIVLAPFAPIPSPLPFCPANGYDSYSIARTALRNGHWRNVAKKYLANISLNKLSIECRAWVEGLHCLAASQIEQFTVEELQNQIEQLENAHSVFQKTAGSQSHSPFFFPMRLVDCLLQQSLGYETILSGFNTVMWYVDEQASTIQIKQILHDSEQYLSRSNQIWADLCNSAFGSDAASLHWMSLQHAASSLILNFIKNWMGKISTSSSLSSLVPTKENVAAQQLRGLIAWIKPQLDGICAGPMNEANVRRSIDILNRLATHPICLPKWFFQQKRVVEIKLFVSKISASGDLQVPSSAQPMPLQVDGSIHVADSAIQIHSLIITAKIQPMRHNEERTYQQRTVEPTERNLFSAQFMFQFKQSCYVELSVEFIDESSRRKWKSPSTLSFRVPIGNEL